MLYRAFVNIFANSLQAMPEGGMLTIRTSITNGTNDASFVEIQVEDTGMGIPKETMKKIFNPFFTTREKGSGLGLAIVQTIVDNHSGEIEVVSVEGHGATIIIRLPLAQPESEAEGRTCRIEMDTILIVDDERNYLLACSRCPPAITTRVSEWGRFGTTAHLAAKKLGKWLLDGGAGETVVPQTQYRDFPYGGFLLKYTFGERLEFGGEVFAHGKEGFAAPQTQASTLIDMGGYYHFKHNPNEQFLFCYGHSIAGQTENYAYVGMYWTWGKDARSAAPDEKKDFTPGTLFPMQPGRNGP